MGSVLKYVSPEARYAQERKKRKADDHAEERAMKAFHATTANIAAHNLLTSENPTASLSASQLLSQSDFQPGGKRKTRKDAGYGSPAYRAPRGTR